MSPSHITEKLGLLNIKNRSWFTQATCAVNGNGLYEGLDWMARELQKKKP